MLVELVTNYVDAHKIVHGGYLFGSDKLSNFIANMTAPDHRHKLLDSVRINTLRQMRISKICAGKEMLPEDWGQLALESKHCVTMTPTYIRKILKWDTEKQEWVDAPRGEPNPEVQNADGGEVSREEVAKKRPMAELMSMESTAEARHSRALAESTAMRVQEAGILRSFEESRFRK
jgi:hypothetical protein